MALGSNIYKLTFESNASTALTPTRREIALSKKIMEETTSATERYGASFDILNQQLNKELITTKAYNVALEDLRREVKESDPEWQRQNALQQQAIRIKDGLKSAEQRALGPMREARELRKAGMLTEQQYHERLNQIKSTLPTVTAAEKRLSDERKRAAEITRQNMTAEERYKQSVNQLPAILLTTRTGVETYRREVVRLRNEYLATLPVQNRFHGGLFGSVSRIAGPIAALTGVSVGIGGVGMAARSGLRSYNEFATGMARSTSIMGDLSEGQLQRMRDTARDVSFDVQASAAEAAESYYFLASAGLDAESSIASMPLVAKFAQAGTFDLSLATDLLTDAQSALGLNVGTTSQKLAGMANIADVLTLAAIKSNATIDQFSTSLTTKAGTALKSYNKDLEEGASVLSVFADQGIKDEVAGTALAIVLRDLSTQAIKNEDAFRKHGVAVFDDANKMRHTGLVVKDLENRLQNLSDKAKKEILLELGFTDKSMGFTQALIGNSERILQLDADYRKAQGTLDDVADKTMSNMTRATNTMKAGWDEFSGIVIPALGDGFLSADGRPLEDTIREINAGVKEMAPLLIDIGKSWGEVAAFTGDTAEAIKPILELWNKVNEATEKFTAGGASLNDLFKPGLSNLPKIRDGFTWLTLKSREWAGLIEEGSADSYFAMQELASGAEDAAKAIGGVTAATEGMGKVPPLDYGDVASQEEAVSAADDYTKKVETLEKELRKQIETFGMSSDEVAIWTLQQEKAGDATTETAKALQDELAAMKEKSRAIEALEKDQADSTDAYMKEFASVMKELENLDKSASEIERDRLIEMGVSAEGADAISSLHELLDARKEIKKAEEEATATELDRIKALEEEAKATEKLTAAIRSNFDAQEVGERSTMEGLARARQAGLSNQFGSSGSAVAARRELSDGLAREAREGRLGASSPSPTITAVPIAIPQPMVAQPSEAVQEMKKQTEFQKTIAKNTAKPIVFPIEEVTL